MRRIALGLCACLAVVSPACADIITVAYTGTYTGSWSGNYNPIGPLQYTPNGPYNGTIDGGQFSLVFTFNTALAQPGHFDGSSLDTPFGGYPISIVPSVGSAVFSSSQLSFTAGSFMASDQISNGTTSQYASSVEFGRGTITTSPIISMQASVPSIFDSILDSFSLSSNQPIGSGGISFDYANTFLGGGRGSLTLSPYSIEVSDQVTAVPDPSTWAMLLIGFAGIGFAAYRKRSHQYTFVPSAVI
jgi:hypothetical protein